MANPVLMTLSLFLGALFIFTGSLKVTQLISREMHREIRRQFVQFAKVLPILAQLGLKVSPRYYRLFVGYTELIGGVVLMLVPRPEVQLVANVALMVLMLNETYAHYATEEPFERMVHSLVFGLMLTCRAIVHFQVKWRDEAIKEEDAEKQQEESMPSTSSRETKKSL